MNLAGAPPATPKTSCKQCFEDCTLVGSKAAGRDPNIRIEDICANNRRNIEKRVQRRDEKDPLKIFWKALVNDKAKLAAWSRKMKHKRKYEHGDDVTMEVVESEVKTFEASKK